MTNEQRKLTLEYVFRQPRQPETGKKPPLLLLLHGFGASEADLIDFAPHLDARFFVASARAPFKLDWGGYAWFEIRYSLQGLQTNAQQAEQSREKLLKFVDELVAKHDLDARRVYLAGFSQGAIMIYNLVLTEPEKFAGAIPMSGVLPVEHLANRVSIERLRDFPIFVSHGVNDQVLPVSMGRAARAFLEKLPVKLDYKEYPIAHNVSEESLADVAKWLTDELGNRK